MNPKTRKTRKTRKTCFTHRRLTRVKNPWVIASYCRGFTRLTSLFVSQLRNLEWIKRNRYAMADEQIISVIGFAILKRAGYFTLPIKLQYWKAVFRKRVCRLFSEISVNSVTKNNILWDTISSDSGPIFFAISWADAMMSVYWSP